VGELSWWAELVLVANRHARKNLHDDVARFAKAQDQAIEKAPRAPGRGGGHLRAAHSHVGALCGVRETSTCPQRLTPVHACTAEEGS